MSKKNSENSIEKYQNKDIKELQDIEEVKTVAKYSFSSTASYIVDISLFSILNLFFSRYMGLISIMVATICARVVSSFVNYFINSRLVFSAYSRKTMVKYYIMVIIQMFNSAVTVTVLSIIFTATSATMIKISVDFFIFFENYMVQKKYIFKNDAA